MPVIVEKLMSLLSIIKDDTSSLGNPQTSYATLAISLPYELLQDIFRLAYPRKKIHDAPQAPDFLVCGQVCSHWRGALTADSYVWSRISLPNYTPDLVNQCFSYSKDRPLEVYIGSSRHPSLGDVFNQIYRIRSLFVETRPDGNYCRRYLSLPAPCLEILCMSGPPIGHPENTMSLFQYQTPNIKHLHLKGTSTLPFRFMFHSLVHLNLQNSPDFPPFNKLFDILELSSSLQEFIFHSNAHIGGSNTASLEDIPIDRRVKIPSLSRIELRAPSSVTLLLIRHIIIPEGTKWSLRCSDVNIMLDKTFLSFLSSHSVGRTGLRCLITGKILYINLYECDGDSEKKIGELHMQIYSEDVFLPLRTLFGSEILLRVTFLELDYANLSFIRTFYDNILWHFPNVWYMTVNVSVQSISTQTMRCFSEALSTKADDLSLPCPSLTHLVVCARINTTAAFEALVSCLHRRHAWQTPVQSLKIVDDTFQITGEDMKKITQYVPDFHIVKEKE